MEGRAILGLHEPARRGDAEEVQAVLHAAADEPTVAVEAVGVTTHRIAANIDQRRARPMRTGVTTIHVGQNIRGYQVADPRTNRPRVLQLYRAAHRVKRVFKSALDAAELAI